MSGLAISAIVVMGVAMIALIIIHWYASVIKKQVREGTFKTKAQKLQLKQDKKDNKKVK